MKNLKLIFFSLLCFLLLSSCFNQIGYLIHISKGQLNLIKNRVAIEEALKDPSLTEDQKNKLRLVSEIKSFMKKDLDLNIDEKVYSTYVSLDEDYVTYLLRVALAYKLEAYYWNFPITGKTPYKGFFDKEKAIEAAHSFPEDQYDTIVRGVSAYSTLGWFEDSILSSMLNYTERDFVHTLFHELAHTIFFFKNQIDLNERFAEFISRKITLLYYIKKEGMNSATATILRKEWNDQLLFSTFMVQEYNELKKWYIDNEDSMSLALKLHRLEKIQEEFKNTILPQLEVFKYDYFTETKLNNAKMLSYRSYNYNMEEFEKLFNHPKVGQSIKAFIEFCSSFEHEDSPEEALSKAIQDLTLTN